jgi:hypothetical protein
MAATGPVMGIDLVDHIVLGESRYCSFTEMGSFGCSSKLLHCRRTTRLMRAYGMRLSRWNLSYAVAHVVVWALRNDRI